MSHQKTQPAIKSLITRISSLILRINEQGQYHAFLEISGHINSIEVRVADANTDYNQTGYDYLLHQEVYYAYRQYPRLTEAETICEITHKLSDLLKSLKRFLKPTALRESTNSQGAAA